MRLQGIQPNLITYTKVISACQMRWIIILHTYSALISACGEGIVPERALQLSDKERKDDPQPNIITYSALIRACGKCSFPERALQLFEERRQD